MSQISDPSGSVSMRIHLSRLITSTARYVGNTTPRVTGRDIAAVVPPEAVIARSI